MAQRRVGTDRRISPRRLLKQAVYVDTAWLVALDRRSRSAPRGGGGARGEAGRRGCASGVDRRGGRRALQLFRAESSADGSHRLGLSRSARTQAGRSPRSTADCCLQPSGAIKPMRTRRGASPIASAWSSCGPGSWSAPPRPTSGFSRPGSASSWVAAPGRPAQALRRLTAANRPARRPGRAARRARARRG